ncbi:MAG: hypothetical protein JNM56_40160 [Planctomycetia bacterium]|nr:hypothetical protein [Planctomycetia bacterium]
MTQTTCIRTIIGLLAASLLCAAAARAEDDDGKGKGPKSEARPTVIQIDVSKLPPDLAKQLLKYAEAPKGKPAEAPKGKSEAAKGKPAPAPQLPPGLAKKAKDHPGRMNFIKYAANAPSGKELLPPPEPKKSPAPSKGKKGGEEE